MNRLFGTDGIRGVAGKSPLTSSEVYLLGRSAGATLRRKVEAPRLSVLGVRDTRISGSILFNQLSKGLREEGIDVYDAGVLSTPSVAYLVQAHHFQSGFVISASHNAPQFNGIKFFTSHGRKWPDEWEREVESDFVRFSKSRSRKASMAQGQRIDAHVFAEDYEHFLIKTLGPVIDFSNFKIALDCSHGANSLVAPEVFRKLGAKLHLMGTRPNGNNINVNCGSQHTEKLADLVKQNRCDVGIAFDGDGDRVILVDELGRQIDGDYVIALLAKYFKKKNLLKNKKVAITVMANLGLKKALARLNIRVVETPVGDRHVSEAMRLHDIVLGGEQSGHIILGHHLPSGDGLLTSLHVLAALKESQMSLSKLVGFMKKYPQVLVNVPVKEKRPLNQLNGFQIKMKQIENILGDDGRVLVRYSGTEPLLRIMLEGPEKKKLDGYAQELVKEVSAAFH